MPTRSAEPLLGGHDLVTFANDWNADPTSKHHIMRRFARTNDVLWIEAAGMLMAHEKASEEWARHRGPSRHSKVAFDVLEHWARLEQTRLPGWSQAMAPVVREWTAVQNGQRSLGEAVTIARPEAEAALARGRQS